MHPLKLAGLIVLGVCLFSASANTAHADNFVLTGDQALTGNTLLHLVLSGPNFRIGAAAEPGHQSRGRVPPGAAAGARGRLEA